MKRRIGLLIVIAILCLPAAGCRQSASSRSDRRTQLVGHENLQLKKQIQAKDQEIERLQNEIKKMEQWAQQEAEKQGDTYTKLLEIVTDLSKQLEDCRAGQSEPAEQ